MAKSIPSNLCVATIYDPLIGIGGSPSSERWNAAHEIGHTIGLVHNYAANVDDRSSVMDYPHTLAKINSDGSIDLSDAYTNDIGEWDKIGEGHKPHPNEYIIVNRHIEGKNYVQKYYSHTREPYYHDHSNNR